MYILIWNFHIGYYFNIHPNLSMLVIHHIFKRTKYFDENKINYIKNFGKINLNIDLTNEKNTQ